MRKSSYTARRGWSESVTSTGDEAVDTAESETWDDSTARAGDTAESEIKEGESYDRMTNGEIDDVFLTHTAYSYGLYEVHRWCVRRLRRFLDILLIEKGESSRPIGVGLSWVSRNNALIRKVRSRLEDGTYMCEKENTILPKLVFAEVHEALDNVKYEFYEDSALELVPHLKRARQMEEEFWKDLQEFEQSLPKDGQRTVIGEVVMSCSEAWEDVGNVVSQAWSGFSSFFVTTAEEPDYWETRARAMSSQGSLSIRAEGSFRERVGRAQRVQQKRRGSFSKLVPPSPSYNHRASVG